ncbi:MAG TPA: hypothetical protein VGK74_14340 [Symbiobacteriaceae bacterium]|jgi:hypothetical protein
MATVYFPRTSASCAGNSLEVHFQEIGLDQNQTITVNCFVKATAHWQCYKRDGLRRQTTNKTTIVTEVEASGDFTSGPDGDVSGWLRISPPQPTPDAPEAGAGTRLVLLSITYSDVQVADQTNHRFIDIPGTFDYRLEQGEQETDGSHIVEASVPVRVLMAVTCGTPNVTRIGPAHVGPAPLEDAPNRTCQFAVTQELCVAVPVNITAQAEFHPT